MIHTLQASFLLQTLQQSLRFVKLESSRSLRCAISPVVFSSERSLFPRDVYKNWLVASNAWLAGTNACFCGVCSTSNLYRDEKTQVYCKKKIMEEEYMHLTNIFLAELTRELCYIYHANTPTRQIERQQFA